MEWAKTTARRDNTHLGFWIWCHLYLDVWLVFRCSPHHMAPPGLLELKVYTFIYYTVFIRPFEKRDVLCRGNVRPSVRPSAFSGIFFNMLWDINLKLGTVETLYNTVNFCWSTHKRHSIARPKGRGMGCLLWVHRATYCVDLSKLSSIKYLL